LPLPPLQGEGWWQAACSRWADSLGSGGGKDVELLQRLRQPQQSPSQELLLLQWRLLQGVSWEDPEGFWPAALRALGIRFATPPTRYGTPQCRLVPLRAERAI
jgi:hypothetical protein